MKLPTLFSPLLEFQCSELVVVVGGGGVEESE